MKNIKKVILTLAAFTFLIIGGAVVPNDGGEVINKPPIGG